MMINLTELPETELTDWYRELLKRGWVWLITEDDRSHSDDRVRDGNDGAGA